MQMMRVTFPPQPFIEQNVCPSHIPKKLQEADWIPHCLRIPNSPAHFSTQITWYWVQINKKKKKNEGGDDDDDVDNDNI